MMCPGCKRSMEAGYLQNPDQPVQWIPRSTRPSCFRGGVAEGAVELGDGGFFRGYRAEAWYCRSCGVVIVPVNQPHSQKD